MRPALPCKLLYSLGSAKERAMPCIKEALAMKSFACIRVFLLNRWPWWIIELPGEPGPSIFQPNQPKRTPMFACSRCLPGQKLPTSLHAQRLPWRFRRGAQNRHGTHPQTAARSAWQSHRLRVILGRPWRALFQRSMKQRGEGFWRVLDGQVDSPNAYGTVVRSYMEGTAGTA